MAGLSIRYRFTMPDGAEEVFNVQLDPRSLEPVGRPTESPPEWTALDFHQCPHCPFSVASHAHCPLAAALVDLVERCGRLISYDRIHVEVITAERRVSQDTTAQIGLSSLMGLLIATSGCPHTAFFKPMARFHLPLATEQETIYRATSTYLLGQYFAARDGRPADLELHGLAEVYRSIETVNAFVARRLRGAIETDSASNALILLDMYAKALPYVIENSVEELRDLFAALLAD